VEELVKAASGQVQIVRRKVEQLPQVYCAHGSVGSQVVLPQQVRISHRLY